MDQIANRLSLPEQPREFGFFVNGRWHEGSQMISRHSPAHGVEVTRVPQCSITDLDAAVTAARSAFEDKGWSGMPGAERGAILLRAASLLRERRHELAYWEVLENGKPIAQALGEVDHCIACFEVGAGAARLLHGDSFNNLGGNLLAMTLREPVGVVGLITPWNFPLLILCERVPFILASGCTLVVKPAEVTSATTLMLADILTEAGLPDGVYNVVTGTGPTIGQAMSEHHGIDMMSFTGSTRVGRSVVHASADSNFKKLGLELGGKNPIVVFEDANLEDAADAAAFGISVNSGQCCISSSRLIVASSIADEFESLLAAKMQKIRVGDPLDMNTQIGAITTNAQNDTILSYIAKGQQDGAQLRTGGHAIDLGRGQFIAPTLLGGVTRDMAVAQDEIFGPVLVSLHFDTVDQAITLANDTVYGLAASVWSKDINTALTATRRIRAGRFWVNCIMVGGPETPLGGFKQSGWGRECGMMGVEEYTQVKTVHIDTAPRNHWIS